MSSAGQDIEMELMEERVRERGEMKVPLIAIKRCTRHMQSSKVGVYKKKKVRILC